MNIVDSLAQSLVGAPDFKGKWRLVDQWAAWRQRGVRRIGAAKLDLDLRIPYEHVVWLRREEEVELQKLRSMLSRGDVFVDCGANIGLWTLFAAHAVGPEGTVFAIEPHPTTFRRLTAHVATLPAEQLSRVVDEKVKHQAATSSSVVVSSSSVTLMPSLNFTPSSTSPTSSWPLNRRQRSWAASSSL
jgi:hypothetical protein